MTEEIEDNFSMPVSELGIISMKGCEEITEKINAYLKDWRNCEEGFNVKVSCPRFSTGESKGMLHETVRGYDIYILIDVFNYGVTYKMYGQDIPMSPDDHFQDLKRVIAAMGGKSKRITVIMPMLYEGRQHRRNIRESLDCALALQELVNMGVENIITFDAHDPRVQNAIPLHGFENAQPYYQMVKALVNSVPDIKIDHDNLMMISPDEGGMSRSIYYSSVLGVDLGMFYKRRDYSNIVNGRNPILSHEFLGDKLDGKDVIVVDDMISSGESILDVSEKLKERGAKRIFVFSTYGLFVDGLDKFDKAYENGQIEKVFTTNLIYRTEELKARPWYVEVDMAKYIAYIIDTLNHDNSISKLLNPVNRIKKRLEEHREN